MRSRQLFSRCALILGLVFLYVPILSMIIFSFNSSRLVTVWDAAHSPTLKWYVALAANEQVLRAAWLSIRIALVASTGAVILGTLAGVALARFGGKTGVVAGNRAGRVQHRRPVGVARLLAAAGNLPGRHSRTPDVCGLLTL